MEQVIPAPLYAVTLLVGMFLLLEVGRRVGRRQLLREPDSARRGLGAIEGGIFAIFGLLLGFTFNGAGARLDSRRMLIADEANAISTAWQRLDLVADAEQPALREVFRTYVAARIEVYRRLPDVAAAKAELARSVKLQDEIWSRAVAATRREGGYPDAGKLLLPAVNEMFDVTTTRTMMAYLHPPTLIYKLLFLLALGCSLLVGHAMAAHRERSWMHLGVFVLTTVITVYMTLDLEYPRAGYYRLTAYDQVLVEQLESMK